LIDQSQEDEWYDRELPAPTHTGEDARGRRKSEKVTSDLLRHCLGFDYFPYLKDTIGQI
jgi:hypothetical protein